MMILNMYDHSLDVRHKWPQIELHVQTIDEQSTTCFQYLFTLSRRETYQSKAEARIIKLFGSRSLARSPLQLPDFPCNTIPDSQNLILCHNRSTSPFNDER